VSFFVQKVLIDLNQLVKRVCGEGKIVPNTCTVFTAKVLRPVQAGR